MLGWAQKDIYMSCWHVTANMSIEKLEVLEDLMSEILNVRESDDSDDDIGTKEKKEGKENEGRCY